MMVANRSSHRPIIWILAVATLVGVGAAVRLGGRGAASSEIDAAVSPSDESLRPEREIVRRAAALRKTSRSAAVAVGGRDREAVRESRLVGRVVAGGVGVSGASVRLHRLNDEGLSISRLPLEVTDQGGAYSIAAVPARYWIVATSPNGRTGSLEFFVPSTDDAIEIPDVEVSKGVSITGTVRRQGEPKSRISVSCRPAAVPEPEPARWDSNDVGRDDPIACGHTSTDRDGRYEIGGLPPGTYEVSAELPMPSPALTRSAGRALVVRVRAPARAVDFDLMECAVTFEFESSKNELGPVTYEIRSAEGSLVTGGSIERRSKRVSSADPLQVQQCLTPGRRYEIAAVAERHLRKCVVFSVPPDATAMTVHVPLEKCEQFGSLSIHFDGRADAIPDSASFRLLPLDGAVAMNATETSLASLSETERRHAATSSLPVKAKKALWSEIDIEAGRYRLETMVAARPRPDTVFLPVEVDIVLGATTTAVVAIDAGGFLKVTVRDTRAESFAANCYVKDASGKALRVGFAYDAGPGSRTIVPGSEPIMTPRLDSGGEPPLAVPLPAGRYTLEVVCPGYETRELPFEIVSGRATKVEAVLQRTRN